MLTNKSKFNSKNNKIYSNPKRTGNEEHRRKWNKQNINNKMVDLKPSILKIM